MTEEKPSIRGGTSTAVGNDVEGGSEQLAQPLDPTSRFTYEAPYRKPYPRLIGLARKHIFKTYVMTVAVITLLWLGVNYWDWVVLKADWNKWWQFAKILSVPVICLGFTWFHVWLALQMMFYPINFIGCCQLKKEGSNFNGMGLGWQGIVPRKAGIMAQRACEAMIGNIVSIEEFMDRVDPEEFWTTLQDTMGAVVAEVLEQVVQKRWPTMWNALPESAQAEIKDKVMGDVKSSIEPALADIKTNINSIIDIKQMSIDALAGNPEMMVDMFREIAPRELLFIQHVAAVMGFILGLVQTVLYIYVKGKYADYYILPISGLIIGWGTNWLALKMTFSPIWPHMMCGNMLNWQGVFLKRQKDAAAKMSQLICAKVIDARAMFKYVIANSDSGVDKVLEIYQKNITRTVEQSVGFARTLVPTFVGQELDDIKQDVIDISLELLPNHMAEIEKFVDRSMKVEETLSYRLARLTPPEFEDIIHPIFKDDEWILLLVGALLGICVGLVQAWAMNNL